MTVMLALAIGLGQPALAKPGPHAPFEVTGKAIKNHDGDTIKIQTAEHGVVVVRLSAADTPETGQAYWRLARDALRRQITGQPVTVWCYKRDRHDRNVCHVSVHGKDPGLALVQQGYAWYAHMFASELNSEMRRNYSEAEEAAKQRRLGLWSEPNPMPPWECRKLRKSGQKCR